MLAAGLAVVTGHVAEEAVEHSGIPEEALEIHEKLGFAVFWIFAAVLGFRLAVRWHWIRETYVLSLLLGIVGVIVLLVASYFGGELVYSLGAGVAGLRARASLLAVSRVETIVANRGNAISAIAGKRGFWS